MRLAGAISGEPGSVVTRGTVGEPGRHGNPEPRGITGKSRFTEILQHMPRLSIFLTLLALTACGGRSVPTGSGVPVARTDEIRSADQLLAAMQARYAGRWFRNIVFVQTSTFLRRDGTASRSETWYEAGSVPGLLRIDMGALERGNGVLYRRDSVYQVQGGRVTHRTRGRNLLTSLAFDAYARPVDSTMALLRAEGIDVGVLHRDSLDGRAVFVVGAGPGDSTSSQFWVDAERLVLARFIQTDRQRRRTQDIRFDRFVQHGGAWVAERVVFRANGTPVLRQEYTGVRVNQPLDSALFIPERWSSAAHWRSGTAP